MGCVRRRGGDKISTRHEPPEERSTASFLLLWGWDVISTWRSLITPSTSAKYGPAIFRLPPPPSSRLPACACSEFLPLALRYARFLFARVVYESRGAWEERLGVAMSPLDNENSQAILWNWKHFLGSTIQSRVFREEGRRVLWCIVESYISSRIRFRFVHKTRNFWGTRVDV